MTLSRPARVAWSLWACSVALLAVALVFGYLTRSTKIDGPSGFLFDVLQSMATLAFPTVGAVVAARRPQNPIGWIFLAVGLPLGLTAVAWGWGTYALLTNPGSLPGGTFMAWLSVWPFFPSLLLAGPLLFMLFPDGRLLSKRWRPVAWFVVATVSAITVGAALKPGPLGEAPFTHVINPLGIPGARGFFQGVQAAGFTVVLAIPVCVAALVVRYRRARGEQRQQLKWFAFTALLFAAAVVAGAIVHGEAAGQLLVLFGVALIPVGAGVAILKHRLYDIDVVINRTLVYGSLTATLGAAYLGSVLLLQSALDAVTSGSSLAVAVSTLAVAALFRPARERIQAIVDKRFYRHKYDAAQTLERFSVQLRQEVDLDALGGELRGVVQDTMQPAHVTLWLRSPEART